MTMTVAEMKAALEEFPDYLPVVVRVEMVMDGDASEINEYADVMEVTDGKDPSSGVNAAIIRM